MSAHTFRRLALVSGALGVLLLQGTPATAAPTGTVTAEVRVGNSGTLGGTATFSRAMQADGTEVLVARAHLLRASVESSLCLSRDAFVKRADWSACPQKVEQTTDVTYSLNLGTQYVGSVLHLQLRIRMPEFANRPGLANGYAGWRPPRQGKDQYGEVALGAATASPTPSPSPTVSPSPSASPTPSPSPTASPSPAASPVTSPSTGSGVSAAETFPFTPTGVNAGNGGAAATRSPVLPVLPVLLLLGGFGLAVVSARRLVRGG